MDMGAGEDEDYIPSWLGGRRKKTCWELRRRWEGTIRRDLRKRNAEVNWPDLVQDRIQMRAFVIAAMNLRELRLP